MVYILVPILLILLLYNNQLAKNNTYFGDYMLPASTKPIKGALAILVIIHHLAQRTTTGSLYDFTNNTGYLIVALFLFYSGYGLMKSYLTKKDYANYFFQRRLSAILIPYLLVSIIYYILYALNGTLYIPLTIVYNILVKGYPLVPFSWYIIAMIYFYTTFGFIIKRFPNQPKKVISLSALSYLVYLIYCLVMGFGFWWFNTPLILVFGMIYAYKEDSILPAIQKYYYYYLIGTTGLFLLLWNLADIILVIPIMYLIHYIVMGTLFSLTIILISMKVHFGNPIINHLGTISLDLYITHGILLGLLRSVIYIQNDLLWCITEILGTIVIASVFHLVSNKVLEEYRKRMKKNKVTY